MVNHNQVRVDRFLLPHPRRKGCFQISVSRVSDPGGTAAEVPVLFVMDADLEFAVAAEIARLASMGGTRPGAMVVGVGYGTTDFAAFARLRTADLTPPLSPAHRQALGGFVAYIGDEDGGAEALLGFLVDDLLPEIARRYPEASTTRRGLFGHSLGGLFAAYALLTRPESFAAFFPASPSLWWDDFAVLRHLDIFTERLATIDAPPLVLVTVGANEQQLPTSVPAGSVVPLEDMRALVRSWRMVDAAAEFAMALRRAGLHDTRHVMFADEGHDSVIPAAMMRSLTLFMAGDG